MTVADIFPHLDRIISKGVLKRGNDVLCATKGESETIVQGVNQVKAQEHYPTFSDEEIALRMRKVFDNL